MDRELRLLKAEKDQIEEREESALTELKRLTTSLRQELSASAASEKSLEEVCVTV